MSATTVDHPGCPYCKRPLRYVPNRWFGRSVFTCEQCGDFPDYQSPAAGVAAETDPPAEAVAAIGHGRLRILVVDDSEEARALYAAMLTPAATVITAARGEDAIALASADPPDVIVLDVLMPGMDGWDTCARLKAEPATADIPIILLTSLDEVDVPLRARRAGASAVLMKPCPVERFVLTINAARRRPEASRYLDDA